MASGEKSADTNLFTVKDVAERLNVSANLIYLLVESGERCSGSIYRLNRNRDVWKQSTPLASAATTCCWSPRPPT